MMKTGFWSVEFQITLEGQKIRWDDLSEATQEYIAEKIKEGYCSGEVVEEEDGAETQALDACPVCGAYIEPQDGEDNGFGELRLYWTCDECGNTGAAIIDMHNNNKFIEHEVD